MTRIAFLKARVRLLESAVHIAAEHGIDDDAMQRVLALAQLSPTQFRNHFTGAQAMWHAVADTLGNELLSMIESTAGEFVDPAKRLGCGVRMFLQEARDNPLFARLVVRRGLDLAGAGSLIHDHVPAHIASGTHSARFADLSNEVAIDVIAGTTLAAVARIAEGHAPAGHPEAVALSVLKALGVPAMQARRLVKIELPKLQPRSGSLLAFARGG